MKDGGSVGGTIVFGTLETGKWGALPCNILVGHPLHDPLRLSQHRRALILSACPPRLSARQLPRGTSEVAGGRPAGGRHCGGGGGMEGRGREGRGREGSGE